MIKVLISFVLGAVAGVILISCCVVGKKSDEGMERMFKDGSIDKLAYKCQTCPFAEGCDYKWKQKEAYMEPVTQKVSVDVAEPIMRETTQIMVNGVLTEVYKDDIQKQIEQALFPERFINYGA